ncbi:MAG TPA: hypothetical protein VGG19_18355 [Tepidisphaeraceae bacterium]|jgi:hypothetical protein
MKNHIAILGLVLLTLCEFAPLAKASLISGWGAESDATEGTVTDTTGTLGAGTFNTSTPTGNLAPRANLPSRLTLTNVGDQIVLSGTVAFASGVDGNHSFRICLLDAPNSADSGTLSSGVWNGSTPTEWLGYVIEFGDFVNRSGTTLIYRHDSGNSSDWFDTSANATIINDQPNDLGDGGADTFSFNLTLTLTSASKIGISYSFASHVIGANNLGGGVGDASPATFSFNAIGFLENTTSGGAATYSNVNVTYIPVPEPINLAMGMLIVLPALRCRQLFVSLQI